MRRNIFRRDGIASHRGPKLMDSLLSRGEGAPGSFLLRGIVACIIMLAMSACHVHEFPEEPVTPPEPEPEPETVLVLDLGHDTSLPLYTSIVVPKSRTGETYDIRHTINIYPSSTAVRGDDSRAREPIYTTVVTFPMDQGLDRKVEVGVDPGDYNVMVWTDYVPSGQTTDWHYLTADFAEITLDATRPHSGCDDTRDAFRGVAEASIAEGESKEIPVPLVRPMARYRIIATDVREFAETLAKAEADGKGDNATTQGGAQLPTINTDDYVIVVRYPGYMTSAFNMFIDHPADSRTGVQYNGQMVQLSDDEMELAFDYVFTNGTETAVTVAVDLYNTRGDLLARSSNINVPLKRSHLTEVRGAFLTTQASGDVGVCPDYEGEFNIEIL